MPIVQTATTEDHAAWLALAPEVERLLGPLVYEASFRLALEKNFARGSAYCVRESDGPPGSALLGGLLYLSKTPCYRNANSSSQH